MRLKLNKISLFVFMFIFLFSLVGCSNNSNKIVENDLNSANSVELPNMVDIVEDADKDLLVEESNESDIIESDIIESDSLEIVEDIPNDIEKVELSFKDYLFEGFEVGELDYTSETLAIYGFVLKEPLIENDFVLFLSEHFKDDSEDLNVFEDNFNKNTLKLKDKIDSYGFFNSDTLETEIEYWDGYDADTDEDDIKLGRNVFKLASDDSYSTSYGLCIEGCTKDDNIAHTIFTYSQDFICDKEGLENLDSAYIADMILNLEQYIGVKLTETDIRSGLMFVYDKMIADEQPFYGVLLEYYDVDPIFIRFDVSTFGDNRPEYGFSIYVERRFK